MKLIKSLKFAWSCCDLWEKVTLVVMGLTYGAGFYTLCWLLADYLS